MPPARRPLRPGAAAAPAPRKKPSLYLLAGLGAAAVGVLALLFVVLGGRETGDEKPAPPPAALPPASSEPEFSVKVHQVDTGRSRLLTLLVSGARARLEDFAVLDAEGREHRPEKADGFEHFPREMQKEIHPLAMLVTVPAAVEACDLRVPGGKKHPVYRAPGPAAFRSVPATAAYEQWNLDVSARPSEGGRLELEVKSAPASPSTPAFDPKTLILLSDQGDLLTPEVQGTNPYVLRYALPKNARELRLQTTFRTMTPDYLRIRPETREPAPKPEEAPKTEAPKPAGNLRAQFDAKLADPMAALQWLAQQPPDEARPIARAGLARFIQEDVGAGVKAFEEGKADLAEKHLVRAAHLSDPYQPELSRQLMRMLFLLKQPRKVPTGCASCRGAGAGPCGGCQAGLAEGPCTRCEGKGQVHCLLCEGSGRQDHHGYKGKVVLTLNDTTVVTPQGRGTLHGQILTYVMSPCASGSFHLNTSNQITCTHKVAPVKFEGSKPCGEFWKEMKLNVFNGRAKIQVHSRKGQLVSITSSAARRFFSDYETCKGGTVSCDLCEGRKHDPCSVCGADGKALVLCAACEGTSQKACAACKGYGETAWLSRLLPAAPGLSEALGARAEALRNWLDERARSASRKEDLARRLLEAKKGLDPSAKFSEDMLDVACPRCKGGGGECVDCWATGRREYLPGSASYERYALVKRLERQLAEAVKPPGPPAASALSETETAGAATAARPVTPLPPRSSAPLVVPKNIDEIIRKADQLHETGRAHLEKAKNSQDNAVWIDEALKAVDDLKNAQTLYATAQEKLDEAGAAVPRELLQKFRINMQALVMARKTVP